MIWNLQVSQKCKKLRKIRKGANHFHCTNLLKSVVLSVTIYVYFVTNTSLFRLSNKKHPCIEFSIFSFMLAKENFLNRKKFLYVHFAEIKVECFTNNTCLYLVPDCLIRNECSLENSFVHASALTQIVWKLIVCKRATAEKQTITATANLVLPV